MAQKDIHRKDIISEEDYNMQMASASTDPQDDSPGDSESDSNSEIMMGMAFEPKEDLSDETADPDMDIQPVGNTRNSLKFKVREPIDLPDTAKVVSSDLPSHWSDQETPSDTH